MTYQKILLASHGTDGARAAETVALDLCAHQSTKTSMHHLLVVPDFWKGMMGDDWLNNAVTQIRFGKYVENQLVNETADEVERIEALAEEQGIAIASEVHLGKPADLLLQVANDSGADCVVIGSPRPKGEPGYRSRMVLETLVRDLSVPLLIVPHPGNPND